VSENPLFKVNFKKVTVLKIHSYLWSVDLGSTAVQKVHIKQRNKRNCMCADFFP